MIRIRKWMAAALSFTLIVSAYTPLASAAESDAPSAPVIVQVSPGQAGPDETVLLVGEGMEGGTIGIRRLADETSPGEPTALKEADLPGGPEQDIAPLQSASQAITGVIPKELPYGQYALWVKGAAGGLSNPVFLNKTDVMYVYPNVLNVARSREVTVIGTNLTRENGTDPGGSRVFLRSKTTHAVAEVDIKSASPYELTFDVPLDAAAGQYDEVWVHNGHGGDYGWSSTGITLTDTPVPSGVFQATAYGAVANDGKDDTQAIQAAIDAAAAAGGGTVVLPEGTFHLDKEQAPPAAGLTKLIPEQVFGGTPSYGTDREYFRAFDSNTATFYDYYGTGSGHVGMDLGEGNAQRVTAIRFFPLNTTNATHAVDMVGGKFQGSNDNVTYTDLYTVTAKPSLNGHAVAVTDPTPYRYLRYMAAEGKKGYIAELEFFTGTAAGPLTVGPKPETGLQKLTLKAGVTLKGQGKGVTMLKYLDTGPTGGRDNGEGPEMILIAGSGSGLEQMSIEGSNSVDRGIVIKDSLQDVTIRSITLNTWFPGPAKKAMFGGIYGDGGTAGFSRILIEDSEMESGGVITLNKMSNSKISGNTFRGKRWTPASFSNSYQNIFTNNRIDGRDDNGKRGGSRGFNFNLHPRWGSFKPTAMNYIARNDTQYIGNETNPTNDGEIILFDALVDVDTDFTGAGNKILHYGGVYASTDHTAGVKGMKWDANVLKDEYVLVVEGKGLGQYRRITGNTLDTITVEEPWLIRPDATSRVAISRFFYKNIVADNTASNNKGNDMRLYGQTLANIFDNNRSVLGDSNSPTAANGGMAINSFDRSLTTFHPSYYNVIQNSQGQRAYVNFSGGLRIESPRSVAALGNIVRHNQVAALSMGAGGHDYFPQPKTNMLYNIFEHNTGTAQFRLDSPVQGMTVVRENTVPGTTPENRYYDFGTATLIIENGVPLSVQRPVPPPDPEIPGDGPMPTHPGNKLVLQEGMGGYEGAADASLMTHHQGTSNNNGAFGEFEMARYNGGGVDDKYALIRFDISQIPADRTIQGAYIELYHTQTRAPSNNFKTVDVHRITSNWVEGNGHGGGTSIDGNTVGTVVDGEQIYGVTYNTRPTWETGPETALDSKVTSYAPGRWYFFDVTEAARQWVLHPEENFGVILMEDTPSPYNGTRTFASSQYSSVTLRPKITIFYSGDPIVIPPDSIPPGDVEGAAAVNGDGKVRLTWKDAADNDILKVRIYQGGSVVAEVEKGVQKADVSGLANGRETELRIVNVDGAGNESPGVTVRVLPHADRSVFWRGVNLNGEAVSINGRPWISYADAKADGLNVTAAGAVPGTGTTSNFPLPFEDIYDLTHMLNTNVSAPKKPLKLEQDVPNGSYRVYLWFMEPSSDRNRSFHVELEGKRVATMAGSELRSRYVKYGPFDAAVSDGNLTLDLLNVKGDPMLQGIEIHRDYYASTILKDLRVDGVTVTDFVYDAKDYTLFYPYGTQQIPVISGEALDPASTVSVTQATYWNQAATVSVASADGQMSSLYRVRLERGAPSTNNDLSDLRVGGATVAGFSPAVTQYEVRLPYGSTDVPAVTAVAADGRAALTVSQAPAVNGTATVEVRAESGDTKQYRIRFVMEPPSSDASLASVSFAGRTVPGSAFRLHPNMKIYVLEAELPKAKDGPVITAVPSVQSHTKVEVQQAKGVPGHATIQVTAQDGKTVQIYRVVFKKEK